MNTRHRGQAYQAQQVPAEPKHSFHCVAVESSIRLHLLPPALSVAGVLLESVKAPSKNNSAPGAS